MPSIDDGDRVMSRFEFEDELLADGFTSMPNTVLYYRGISMGAKATYLVLLSYAWREMRSWPGQEKMAAQLGIGVRTIRNYLKELEAHGIIRIRQRGLTMTSDVIFLRLGHLRAAESAVQERQASRTPRAADPAVPERQPVPTKNNKRTTTKDNLSLPLEDAGQVWAGILDHLRTHHLANRANLNQLAELPVRLDGTTLVVRGERKWAPLIRQAAAGRAVRFE